MGTRGIHGRGGRDGIAVKAELDFVVIDGDDVLIYSAKIDPKYFDPTTDHNHWIAIRDGWDEIDHSGRVVLGNDRAALPATKPVVENLSAELFGMKATDFLTALLPNWEQRLQ